MSYITYLIILNYYIIVMLNFIEKQSKSGKNKYLMILLHGYGCDKNDLMPLSDDFALISNDICFISVDAPEICDSGFGYQWFPLKNFNFTAENVLEMIKNNINYVSEFINFQSKRLKIDYKNIFLLGFSQGAMVSLATSIRLDKKIGGVISFSGFQPDTKETLKKDLRTKQNVLLVHGVNDPIVPYNLLIYSKDLLEQFSIDVEICPCLNLEHSINNFGLNTAVKYIEKLISVQ